MKKWLKWAAIALLLFIVTTLLARNFIARKALEGGVQEVTGFPLAIGSLRIRLLQGQVEAGEVRLFNPPEFPEKLFVNLPRLRVEYEPRSLFRHHPHIHELGVDIEQMVIVKNKQGESNLAKLKGAVAAEPGAGSKAIPYRIDTLRLQVGTVRVMDFSGANPTEHNYPLNLDVTYHNITDATDINRLVLIAVLNKLRLPEIGLRMEDLKKGLGEVKNAAGELMRGTAGTLEKVGKGLLETLEKVVPGQGK